MMADPGTGTGSLPNEAEQFRKRMNDIKTIFAKYSDFTTGTIIVPILLYCISFSQLVEQGSTEYISWILTTALNLTFPFTWFSELLKCISHAKSATNPLESGAVLFSVVSVGLTYLAHFIMLIFVLLKNENIRKRKERNGEFEKGFDQNLKVNDTGVELIDRIIAVLFITSSVVIWAIVGGIFYLFVPYSEPGNESNKFPVGERVKSMISIFYSFMTSIDSTWHSWMNILPIPTVTKALLVYCVVFIVVLFTFFLRLKYRRSQANMDDKRKVHPYGQPPPSLVLDSHEIVNIPNIFGSEFDRNIYHYERFGKVLIVFLTLFLGCTGIGLIGTLNSWSHIGTLKLMVPVVIAVSAIMFPILFMSKGNVFNPAEDTYVDLHMSSVQDINDVSGISYLDASMNTQENKVKYAIHVLSNRFYKTYFVYDTLDDDTMFADDKGEDYNINDKWKYLLSKYHSTDLYATIDKKLHQDFLDDEAEKFRGTMEQIFAVKYKQFREDRNTYGNNDQFTIYVGSQEYRNKKKDEEVRKNNKPLKRFLFFILSLFTGILGAPVVIGIIDSVMSLFLNGGYFIGSSSSIFVSSLIVIVILITGITFITGTDKTIATYWHSTSKIPKKKIHSEDSSEDKAGKKTHNFTIAGFEYNDYNETNTYHPGFFHTSNHLRMRTFLAILTTMIISTIFALTTKYDFFTFIAKTIGTLLKYSIFTIFPLGILIFGALLIYYSYMNYKRFRKEVPST
jgi:hypothetical protein